MKLSSLSIGGRGCVCAMPTGGAYARLAALGVRVGAAVTCLYRHPAGDPIAYLVGETVVAMRRSIADEIEMESS